MLQWLATKSPKKEDPETPQEAESDMPQVSRQFLQKSLFPSKGGSWSDGRSGGAGAFWQAASDPPAQHFRRPRPKRAARNTIVIAGSSPVCVSWGRGDCLGNSVNTSGFSREGLSCLGPRILSGVGGQPGRGRAPPSIHAGRGGRSRAHGPLLVGLLDLSEPDPTDLSLT